jgi:sucrose phosphorylase
MESMDKVQDLLEKIYGEEAEPLAFERIGSVIEKYTNNKSKKESYFSQEDVVLITYGDSLKKDGEAPLATLHEFAKTYLNGAISNIHFLPFFPYRSWIFLRLIPNWAHGKRSRQSGRTLS